LDVEARTRGSTCHDEGFLASLGMNEHSDRPVHCDAPEGSYVR
jgi:hypothetical protein